MVARQGYRDLRACSGAVGVVLVSPIPCVSVLEGGGGDGGTWRARNRRRKRSRTWRRRIRRRSRRKRRRERRKRGRVRAIAHLPNIHTMIRGVAFRGRNRVIAVVNAIIVARFIVHSRIVWCISIVSAVVKDSR